MSRSVLFNMDRIVLLVDAISATTVRGVCVCSAIYRLDSPTAISSATPHTGNWLLGQSLQVAFLSESVLHHHHHHHHHHCTVRFGDTFSLPQVPIHYSARVKLLQIPNFSQIFPQNSAEIHICQMSPNAVFEEVLHKTKTSTLTMNEKNNSKRFP